MVRGERQVAVCARRPWPRDLPAAVLCRRGRAAAPQDPAVHQGESGGAQAITT
jgi:hypothetical protein